MANSELQRRIEQVKGDNEQRKKQIEQERLEKQKEEKSIAFNEKLIQLAERTVKFEQEYGPESPFTIVLNAFFEAALEMQKMMEQLDALNLAVSCLGEAMNFMDSALEFDQSIMQTSLQKDYGFFARMKARREKKKAIRNNYGRIMRIFDNIVMNYKLITDMSTSMTGLSAKIKKSMGKMNKKNPQTTGGAAAPGTPSSASQFLAKKGLGGDGGAAPSAPGAAPTGAGAPPAPSAPSSVGSGIDGL